MGGDGRCVRCTQSEEEMLQKANDQQHPENAPPRKWKALIKLLLVGFAVLIITHKTPQASLAADLQSVELPANIHNIEMNDVVAAFNALDDHGTKMGAYLPNRFREEGGLLHKIYTPPQVAFLNGSVLEQATKITNANNGADHFQSIQRLKDGYFVVSGSGVAPKHLELGHEQKGGHLIFLRLGTKSGVEYEGQPLGSNLLAYADSASDVPTRPLIDSGSNDSVVVKVIAAADPANPDSSLNKEFYHAGGMSLLGDLLVVPLESHEASKIVFYDVSDPAMPVKLPYEINRQPRKFVTPDNEDVTITRKGGATFLGDLPDGRLLLGVWSDSDKAEIPNSSGVSLFDYSSDYFRTLDLYVSLTAGAPDFDYQSFSRICVDADWQAEPDIHDDYSVLIDPTSNTAFTNINDCDNHNPVNDQFPDGPDESNFQNLNLVKEVSGKSYLIGTYNNGDEVILSGVNFSQQPYIELREPGIGNGKNWAVLYEFEYDVVGGLVDPQSIVISNEKIRKEMHCEVQDHVIFDPFAPFLAFWRDDGALPFTETTPPVSDSYCNFQAGTGIYIQNPDEFSLYAVDHYLRGDEPDDITDFIYLPGGEDIRFQEFRPALSTNKSISNINNSWIEIYEHILSNPRYLEGTNWMIDYRDHALANYDNFEHINKLELEVNKFDFNDELSSVRAMVPDGYGYLLYEHDDQEGRCLRITGQDTLRTIDDIRFGSTGLEHLSEPEVIAQYGSACLGFGGMNDRLSSSGSPSFQPLSASSTWTYPDDGFVLAHIDDPNAGWIQLFENRDFNGAVENEEGGRVLIVTADPSNTTVTQFSAMPDNDYIIRESHDEANFNDKVSSIRYQLPPGYTYRLYEDSNYNGRYIELIGTGKIEEINSLGNLNFNDTVSSSRFVDNTGLLAYWQFEGYERVDVNGTAHRKYADFSGSNNHLYTAEYGDDDDDTAMASASNTGYAVQFGDESVLWAGSEGTVPNNLTDFTYSFWVQPEFGPIGQPVLEGQTILELGSQPLNPASGFFNQARIALAVECDTSNGFGITHSWTWETEPTGNTGTELTACTSHTWDESRLFHVAITYEAGIRRIYINGQLLAEDESPTGPAVLNEPLAYLLLGSHLPGNTSFAENDFNGFLDDTRIYDHAFTEAEIINRLFAREANTSEAALNQTLAEAAVASYTISPPSFTLLNNQVAAVTIQTYDIDWDGGGCGGCPERKLDIYLGTDPEQLRLYESNLPDPFIYKFNDVFENDTTYYGRLVIKDDTGRTSKSVYFSFTTEPNNAPPAPANPTPADNATGQQLILNLAWDAVEDIDQDVIVYDLYFGESPDNLELLSAAQWETSYAIVLEPETTYYWQVIASDTKQGEVSLSTSGPIWSFSTRTNSAPTTPTNLAPTDGATNQPFHDLTLSWDLATDPDDDIVLYNVYIGESASELNLAASQIFTDHVVLDLEPDKSYFWQVTASDLFGSESSSVIQQFDTRLNQPPAAPVNPTPADGAVNQPYENLLLSWQATDPDGDDLLYDVYLGETTESLTLTYQNLTEPNKSINLSPETTYYWQIVAKDGLLAAEAASAIWSFTTASFQEGPPDSGVSPDADTSLLLYFNDIPYLEGVDGEIPLSSGLIAISIEEGLFGLGASFPTTASELYYNSYENIDEREGSLDFWIQPAWHGNDNQDHTVLRYGYWGGLIFSKDAGNNLRGVFNRFGNNGNPEVNVEADISTWFANEWHHVAYTWNANFVRLYVDGVLQDEATVTTPLPFISDTSFQIGGDDTSSYLGAKLDDFRISSRVRTAAEILAVYQYGSQFINQENQPPSAAANPIPADGATDRSVDVTLGWDTAVDPDGDPVTYDVYWGLDPNALQLISSDQTETTFTLDTLLYSTTYYWRVDAKDDQGHVTEGAVWEFVTEPLPGYLLTAGYYEETDSRFVYDGNWLPWYDDHTSRNSIVYTGEFGASLTFQIYGAGLTIYRNIQPDQGNMEVCIDADCTLVSNYHASTLFQSPVSFTGLGLGVHQITINNVSAKISLDAFEVLDPQPLRNGVHENDDPNIIYSGKWIEWFHDYPLGQGSLTYSVAAGATAEFYIDGDTMILYHSTASGYGNTEVCIDERPCETFSNYSATPINYRSKRFDDLGSGIHHVVIRVVAGNTNVIDAIEVLTENGALQAGLHQETSELIEQVGVWQPYTHAKANGGTGLYTNDPAAELHFLVEGDQFIILRSTGLNRGNTEVCIDGVCETKGNFDTEYTFNQPLVIAGLGSGIHEVILKNASSSTSEYMTFEAILIPEPLTIGIHQDNNINLLYYGDWTRWADDNHVDRYTYDNAASVEFSFMGDGLIVRRPTNTTRTDIAVCVDGAGCAYSKGYSSDPLWDVPMSITNLGFGLHHARVYPVTSTPSDSVLIDLDEVEILGPSVPVLPGQTLDPNDDSHFVHNGRWPKYDVPGSVGENIFYNNQIGDAVNFVIEGDEMILYFTQATWGGILQVCIDGTCEMIDQYSATTIAQASRAFSNLGEGLHEVTISNASFSIFTSNIWVDVEAVEVIDTP